MLKIEKEIIQNEDESSTKQRFRYIINGKLDKDAYFFDLGNGVHAYFYDSDIIEELLSYSFSDLRKYFLSITISYITEHEDHFKMEIYFNDHYKDKSPFIKFELNFEFENWNKGWSILTYSEAFKKVCIEQNMSDYLFQSDESVLNGFGININLKSHDLNINDEVEKSLDIFDNILQRTNEYLLLEYNSKSLTTLFNFPDEIKISCEQYLIYFSQFLLDIGINADTEIRNQAKNVLFIVTPKDENVALSNIKNALDVYLQLPNLSNLSEYTENENDIAIKHLESVIYFLKSQLLLSNAIIQAKDATIESLQLTNHQYKYLIDSNPKKQVKEEELMGGIVKIKEYEGNGISIDLAEIFRRLKRKIIK